MSSLNGRSNRNERGSSYDRRARRAWLTSAEAGFGGDGQTVPCWECGRMLTADQVTPDRKVPGEHGGTYRRGNIRGPHCRVCSCRQGQRRTAELRAASDPYGSDDLCLGCGAHYLVGHAEDCKLLGVMTGNDGAQSAAWSLPGSTGSTGSSESDGVASSITR